jgi:uncharacterized protein (TIGR03000 family)
MKRFPFCLTLLLVGTAFLAMPLQEASAQRGGRGVGGGARPAISGGRGVPVGGARGVGGFGVGGFNRAGFGFNNSFRTGFPYRYGYPFRGYGFGWYGGWYPYSWPYSYYGSGPIWVGDFFGGYAYDYVPPGSAYGPPSLGSAGGYMPIQPDQMPGGDPNARPLNALVQVYVPTDDAELWFNGFKTVSSGQKREFTTPELTPGKLYSYEVRTRWMQDGKQFDRTRTLQVQAGAQAVMTFSPNDREELPIPKEQVLPMPSPKNEG